VKNHLTRRAFIASAAVLTACQRGPRLLAKDVGYGASVSQRFDIYGPAQEEGRSMAPWAMLIHGGGWVNGSRDDVTQFIPELTSRGYVVANTGYRLAEEAKAPAAAEDIRTAIAVVRAKIAPWADADRMLLIGLSAGAHLALLSALAPETEVGGPQSHPRAVLSLWGVTDVADLLAGAHAQDFARQWLSGAVDVESLARRMSPVSYDVTGAPYVCAAHSVYDSVVPFSHSETLVQNFRVAGKPADLLRLSHPDHGAPQREYPAIFAETFRLLNATGVMA
jgi:acetyl esterase/lipase